MEIPAEGAEGVIVAEADRLGGFALFVQDGKLKRTYSMLGVKVFRQEATGPLPSGTVNVRLEFTADSPGSLGSAGTVTLFANEEEIGSGRLDVTVPLRFSDSAAMDVGRDNGSVVDVSYADKAPFAFTGTVNQVVFEIVPDPIPTRSRRRTKRSTRAGSPSMSA